MRGFFLRPAFFQPTGRKKSWYEKSPTGDNAAFFDKNGKKEIMNNARKGINREYEKRCKI